ncbi:MAG: UxaA family hydrolase [Saprospiraceae bacterium]|nr:UxaA family hydrolase [Saprospiraceae bacterium]
MENSKLFIQLDESDNVLLATQSLAAGTLLHIAGQEIKLEKDLGLGFKIASCNIMRGEKIIKCGVSIGSATSNISIGELIHLHNLQSDYVPTYTIQNQRQYGK